MLDGMSVSRLDVVREAANSPARRDSRTPPSGSGSATGDGPCEPKGKKKKREAQRYHTLTPASDGIAVPRESHEPPFILLAD